MKGPDDYSFGIASCCSGSVILVIIIYLGHTGLGHDLLVLIAFSIVLHVLGLLLIMISFVINRWQTEASMYYDWGLEGLE